MALIDSLRQTYPMYSEKSDDELIQGYMNKFHPDKTVDQVEGLLSQRQEQEQKQPEVAPETDEGVAQEFFEGVGSGLIAIPQGILELGASGIDLIADTDYASSVTDAANKLRDAAGIDPEGVIGKGAEVITQFVVPGLGAASAVSKLSKVGRLNKALRSGKASALPGKGITTGERLALGAQQVAAAGAADAMVATDGTTTIADFFEGGPTQTDQEIGLSGREEALRRLTNKLKIGAETGAATIVAPALLSGTATVAGKVLTETPILSDAVSGTARGLQTGARKITSGLDTIEAKRALGQDQGFIANTLADVSSVFRYRGFLPEEIAEARLAITGETDAVIKESKVILSRLDTEVDKVLKEADKVTSGASTQTKQSIFTNIEEFLTGATKEARQRALDELPENVAEQARSMRGLVKRLNEDILQSDYMKSLDNITTKSGKNVGQRIRKDIEKNLNTYLRRRYQSFEVKNYVPTAEVMSRAIKGFQENPQAVADELGKIIEGTPVSQRPELIRSFGLREVDEADQLIDQDGLKFVMASDDISEFQARTAAEHFLKTHSKRSAAKSIGITRVAEHKINPKLFSARINLPKYKRELLGEITDPKESFIGTIADLAEFRAVDNYFGRIRKLATETVEETLENGTTRLVPKNPGIAKLFRDTSVLEPGEKAVLREQGFKILDEGKTYDEGSYGSLAGMAVASRVANDLERIVIGDTGVLGNAARNTYSAFLRTKGATQFGKTVLSPITQLRNVTTASAFALAQGNIGRGSNLGESVRLVYNNLFTDVSDEQALRTFQELQELGVVGSQAQLRELQDLVKQGLGYGSDEINGFKVGGKFGGKYGDTKLGSFLGNIAEAKPIKTAENLYQAGDDIWKIYNFNFELNKLRNAYRAGGEAISDDVLKQQAARIVRNTVPNYNMAPEFIKTLRRAPVGNFIAFPYEILRTGANTIAIGIDELAFTSANKALQAEIRKTGLRRLTGAITTFGALPAAVSAASYELSGVSEEEMKAYQRSLAPPWEKNARLVPTGRDKETGLPTYVNYSYSNPYDMLEKIAIAAINKAEQGQREGKNGAVITFEAANESLRELFAPFTEEAIITAKLRDVFDPESETIGARQIGQLIGGRGGRTVTGAKVYNEEDSAGDKLAKSFAHVLDGIIPSVVPIDVRSGEFEVSRFGRGVVSGLELEGLGISTKDRMLRERELSKELARAFSGITENPIESTALKFKGYEFSRARTNANNIFTTVSNRGNATPQDFVDAYRRASEASFRVQSRMFNIVEDMKLLGMTKPQIRKVFRDAGIGGVNNILRGKFDPINISPTVRKNVRRNELDLPRQEINRIRKEFRNLPLGTMSPPEEKETPTLDLEPVSQSPTIAPTQQVAASGAPPPVAQAGGVNPLASPAPSSRDTSLLGGNPIDILKNLQIFQRQ